jgi:hypothetical protein
MDAYNAVLMKNKFRAKESASLTFQYFVTCCNVNTNLFSIIRSSCATLVECADNDLIVLCNFYASVTLRIISNGIHDNGNHAPLAVLSVHRNGLIHCDGKECDRSLICLGGGTLAEIIKVNKRRIILRTISSEQRRQSRFLFVIAKAMCMNSTEKQALPIDLANRDNGGMYFPKKEFFSFIQRVNNSTVMYASTDGVKRHGKNLIKVITFSIFLTRLLTLY